MGGGLQEGAPIDRAVVDADFEMQVQAGGAAGAADQPDNFTGVKPLPPISAVQADMWA